MWSSKVCSKKHTHSFRCEDQISPNHKKKHHDRTKNNNNFVIREVPIQKLFNVEHCTNNNGRRDFSDRAERKNYSSTDMNGTDYDTPELVVFIQEDRHQQYVKDICIDRRISSETKYDMNERSDLNLGIMETMSNNSFRPKCASQHPSFKEAMKVHGFRNLMKSEMELSLGDRFSIDHRLTKKTSSETLREVRHVLFLYSLFHFLFLIEKIRDALSTNDHRVFCQITPTSSVKSYYTRLCIFIKLFLIRSPM